MRKGELRPGSVIDMAETSQKLGVSRTPLRDALLQLAMEGFVSILPRRRVVVNLLTIEDIKNYYEIIGALESRALLSASEKLSEADAGRMEKLNEEMRRAIERDDFDLYYEKNLKFHNTYLSLSGNENLEKIVNMLKKRLYDFPRQEGFVKEWEEASIKEHQELVNLIKQRKIEEAASFIRDVHWSFPVQETFVKKYYKKSASLL
jgi:DNA-binding GntR family transcriptional regulator